LLFVLAVILHSRPAGAESSSYVGSIKDFEPTDIEIKIMRNGAWEQIGAGATIKVDETISIRDWCHKRDVSSHVVINTATGEVRLDCGKDGRDIVQLTAQGFVIPQIQRDNTHGTVPTITGQQQPIERTPMVAAVAAPPPTDYLAGKWSVIDSRTRSQFATFEFEPSGQLRANPDQSTRAIPKRPLRMNGDTKVTHLSFCMLFQAIPVPTRRWLEPRRSFRQPNFNLRYGVDITKTRNRTRD
jgi:hypothetical protein